MTLPSIYKNRNGKTPEQIAQLDEWLDNFFTNGAGSPPYAIIHGTSGNGKTFLVECLAKAYDVDLLRFTADDFDDVNDLEKSINLQSINSNRGKIVLFDDAQDIRDRKNRIRPILYTLWKTSNYPIIYIFDKLDDVDKEFMKNGLNVKIRKPMTSDIEMILQEKNIPCDCIHEIAYNSNSVRTALQGLLIGRPIEKISPMNYLSYNLKLFVQRELKEDFTYLLLVTAFRSIEQVDLKSYRLMEELCKFDEIWNVEFFRNKNKPLDPIFANNIKAHLDCINTKPEFKEKKKEVKKVKEKESEFCYAGADLKEEPKPKQNITIFLDSADNEWT